jgi:hypothetical protein
VTLNTLTTSYPTTTPVTLPYCSASPVGACPPSYSPYEPLFLSNSTVTNFNYPIYEQIVCYGGRLALVCPANLVIHIYSGKQNPFKNIFKNKKENFIFILNPLLSILWNTRKNFK